MTCYHSWLQEHLIQTSHTLRSSQFTVSCCVIFRGFSHQQLSDEAAVHFSWFASSSAAGSVETCPRQEETEGMAAGFDWQSELCDYGLHTPQ